MSQKHTVTNGVVMPFSPDFLLSWQLWKDFKQESFNFKYKGCISEQMAIKHLVELSDGLEEKAVKIIEQSIRRSWQGFYPLKETTHGTAKQKQPSPKKDTASGSSNIESRVSAAFTDRYGKWENPGSEPHLKAV